MNNWSPNRSTTARYRTRSGSENLTGNSNDSLSNASSIAEINALLVSTETKSVERALYPLVKNLQRLLVTRRRPSADDETSLMKSLSVQPRDNEFTAQLLADTGAWVARAADHFAAAGRQVAAESPPRLAEAIDTACRDAAAAGRTIARLTLSTSALLPANFGGESGQAIRLAAGRLVEAVTRTMALADRLCLQKLLASKERAAACLDSLEGCSRFSDFMPAFAGLGEHLVQLGRLSGERQVDLKSEPARCRLAHCRSGLERALPLLLAASKLHLRHPENRCAQRLRQEMFAHIRHCLDSLAEASQPICVLASLRRLRRQQLPAPSLDERRRLANQAGLIAEAIEAADAAPIGVNYKWRRLENAWRGCVAACGLAARLPTEDDCWTVGADWLEYQLGALGGMLLTAARAHDLLAPESRVAVACLATYRDAWKSAVAEEFGHLLLTVIHHLEVADSETDVSAELAALAAAAAETPDEPPVGAASADSPAGYENVTPPRKRRSGDLQKRLI